MSFRTDGIPSTEYSTEFIQGMLNRMGVSFHKYGKLTDAFPNALNAIESLRLRLEKYEETGNTEWLMDVANYAMIEFMLPRHPDAHYRATDSKEAPGRIDNRGRNVRNMQNLDVEDA